MQWCWLKAARFSLGQGERAALAGALGNAPTHLALSAESALLTRVVNVRLNYVLLGQF